MTTSRANLGCDIEFIKLFEVINRRGQGKLLGRRPTYEEPPTAILPGRGILARSPGLLGRTARRVVR